MPGQQAVPPLLVDYLCPRPGSLTLITGTLGASPSWVILGFLAAVTDGASRSQSIDAVAAASAPISNSVALTSWLHDPAFWRESGRKLPINFSKINLLNYLNEPLPASLAVLAKEINSSIPSTVAPASTTLIVDGLDFLLASTSHTAQELLGLLSSLRQSFGRVIITAQADAPFLHVQGTPLEVSHAAFVTSLAHQAETVMSLRELETGAAKDVSGILRVTQGGQGDDVEQNECLYLVEGGGTVKVVEKGT